MSQASSTTIWPTKHPLETITCEMEFAAETAAGDRIVAVEVVVTTVLGTDALPGDVKLGAALIKGHRVFQQLRGGLSGCSYRIEVRATTALNNVLILARVLPVAVF
jgi:hypothetical protein